MSGLVNATFKPGLYGDGDASEDRSAHKWMLFAIDKRSGKVRWERVAHEGPPAQKRHVKSTYASATPVTDGRIVVASGRAPERPIFVVKAGARGDGRAADGHAGAVRGRDVRPFGVEPLCDRAQVSRSRSS